jgi:galacturan 1,4-alpha-galacturonidase
VAISSGASNVLVHDCYFGHGHGARIGSVDKNTAIQNITFTKCTFENTECAAKIKSRPGATGYVRNIKWTDCKLKNVRRSMSITMFYSSTKPDKKTTLKISDITISGFTSKGTTTDEGKYVAPGSFTCQPSAPCKGIVLKDISHESKYPFEECLNAYGSEKNVSPKSCLKKGGGEDDDEFRESLVGGDSDDDDNDDDDDDDDDDDLNWGGGPDPTKPESVNEGTPATVYHGS